MPKVVLAAQTRVLEVAVDVEGRWWPSVPTIAVVPTDDDPAELWRIASVLSAPATTAWCLEHFGGSALSSDAVKVSASQALSIPLPSDTDAWSAGAGAAAAAHTCAERRRRRRAGASASTRWPRPWPTPTGSAPR